MIPKPLRIQLSRRKGWKMPENTVYEKMPTTAIAGAPIVAARLP